MTTFPGLSAAPAPASVVQTQNDSLDKLIPTVHSFRGDYFFLSNMFKAPVHFQGVLYPASENAYMASRLVHDAIDEKVYLANLSPKDAKKAFHNTMALINARHPQWNDPTFKVRAMLQVCRAKFEQNPALKTKLLATGPAVLIEGNTWRDTFWGTNLFTGEGTNYLGRVLMALRWEWGCPPCGSFQLNGQGLLPQDLLPMLELRTEFEYAGSTPGERYTWR